MRRTAAGLVAAVLGSLLLLAAALLLAVATPAGTRFLLGVASGLAGPLLAVTGVRGTLLTGLAVDDLVVELPTVRIEIDELRSTATWPALRRGELRLATLRAGAVRVRITPDPEADDEPVPPLILPFGMVIDALRVARLQVQLRDDPPIEITDLALRGALLRGDIALDSLALTTAGVRVNAAGRFGTGEPFSTSGTLVWDMPDAGIKGRGTVAGNLAALRLRQILALPEPAAASGTLRLLDDAPRFQLDAELPRLVRPVDEARTLTIARLRVTAAGWLDDLRLVAGGDLTLSGYPAFAVTAEATGNLERLTIPRLNLNGRGGRLEAKGALTLEPELAGDFAFSGRQLDPGLADPRLRGRIDADGRLSFAASGDFALDIARAAGVLDGRRASAQGRIARTGSTLAVDGLRLAAGRNRVDVDGRWGDQLAFRFQVDAPALGALWPDLGGSLRGRGQAGGTLERPTLNLDLSGSGLRVGEFRADELRAKGGVGARNRVDLAVTASGLALPDRALGELRLTVRGELARHDLDLRLRGGDVGVDVQSTGGLSQGRVGGELRHRIAAARIDLPEDLDLTLDPPMDLVATTATVTLAPHCWTALGTARLCVGDTRAAADTLATSATLRDLPLAPLGPYLPDWLALDGYLDADLVANRRGSRWTGTLKVAPRSPLVTLRVPDDDDVSTRLEAALLELDATTERVRYRAELADSFGLNFTAAGEVLEPFAAEPGIAGSLSGGIPDLARLSPLADQFLDVADLKGSIRLDATLSGRLRAPSIDGGLELRDGALTVPVAGITVDRINLALTGGEAGQATLLGNARSGKGFAQLTGELAWDADFVPRAEIILRGRQLDVINIPEAYVQVAPNVRAVLAGGQFRVSGEVQVPEASIRPKRIGDAAVAPSPDTIVHGRDDVTAAAGAEQPFFVLDGLQVRLGKKVRFDGFGLRADLEGGLTLAQDVPAEPGLVTGTGVVQIKGGEFQGLGQRLAIERGSLLFAGPVTDPGLDVKAKREINDAGRSITVGVLLTGRLSRIETRVYSEPAMGEMDALAYLTTGRSLAGATAGDRLSVANAALLLGARGATPFTNRLSGALRIDEIGVEGAGGDNTAVVIGERFGEDLYVRYSYGIFDQVGTIRATYRLGRRISIEGSSGEQQALDLIYSITW